MLIFQEFRAKMQPSNSTNRMNMVRSSSYTSLESASEQQPTSSLRRQQSAPNSQNTTPLKSVNNSASNSPLRATADSRVRAIIDYWYSHTCLKRPLLLPASLLEFIFLVSLSFYFSLFSSEWSKWWRIRRGGWGGRIWRRWRRWRWWRWWVHRDRNSAYGNRTYRNCQIYSSNRQSNRPISKNSH